MKTWIMFITLAMIWSASFLLIKVGIAPEGTIPTEIGKFDPVTLAATRLVVASACYLAFVLITRHRLPRSPRTWLYLFIAGFFNNAVPYMLITWGEKTVDSGLASVLNGTVPLFSLIIAHFALSDDKITLGKIFGIIGGFTGILLLATRSLDPGNVNAVEGQLAIVLASASYAGAAVFIRKTLSGLHPYVVGAGSITMGALIMITILLVTVRPLPNFVTMQPESLRAVLALGFFNTFLAYLLLFNILPVWGASRTTMVTYVMPPMGILLGVIFENEKVDWRLIVGTGLILGGIVAANLLKQQVHFGRSAVVAEAKP